MFEIDDNPDRVDRAAVVTFLTEHAYWGKWRGPAEIEHQIAVAWRVVGAYDGTGRMVGFARAVSDGLALAYLADVYVEPDFRGHGLGVAIVRAMIDEGPGADFRWMLHTADASGLYRKFGFDVPDPMYMERPASPAKQSVVPEG